MVGLAPEAPKMRLWRPRKSAPKLRSGAIDGWLAPRGGWEGKVGNLSRLQRHKTATKCHKLLVCGDVTFVTPSPFKRGPSDEVLNERQYSSRFTSFGIASICMTDRQTNSNRYLPCPRTSK